MVVTSMLCTSCGSPMPSGAAVCGNCGNSQPGLTERRSLQFSTEPEPPRAKRERPASLLSMVLPRPGQPNVMLPMVATGIGLFALIPICMYAIDSSYQATAHNYLNEKAMEAIKTGQNTDAVEIMVREKIEHRTLRSDQQQILDQALYERAGQALHSRSYDLALSDLSRISHGFPTNLVEQRLAQVNYQIAHQPKPSRLSPQKNTEQPPQPVGAISPPVDSPPAEIRKRSATERLQELAAKAIGKAGLHESETRALQRASILPRSQVQANSPSPQSNASSIVPPQSVAPESSISTAEQSRTEPEKPVLSARARQTKRMGDSNPASSEIKSDPDFVPIDLVRYNEQLASYFSHEQKGTHEPPTFKEWVKLGKPKFQ